MKKRKLFINAFLFTSIFCAIITSCASNNQENPKNNDDKVLVSDIPEQQEEILIPEPTAEELFLQKIDGIKIEFTKIPPKTKKNKDFSSAYELLVTDKDSNPLTDFEVALIVPVKGSDNKVTSTREVFITDENGCVSYMPSTPDFAANTKVAAFPFVPDNLVIDNNNIEPYKTYADFLVESDVASKGAIMFVFEYNENGKAPKNSYDILSGLRKKGVYQIGNAPISDTDYINASKEKIYKENYEYVGTDYGYLIGGTVKFANPVEKDEDGTYTATMVANIYGIEMKTGYVIYENNFEYTSSGANWNKAVESCKQKLNAQIVNSIMFGL